MAFVEDDDVIQALSTNRSDQTLDVWILPGRSPSGDNLFNSHVGYAILELVPVDAISITNQEPRRRIIGKRLNHLLTRPRSRWMSGDVEMDNHPAVMSQDDEGEQYAESSCRNGEEVDRYDVS